MFKHTSRALKEAQQPQLNFSNDLPPAHYETLGSLSLHGEISCQAYDPVQSLLAIGTKSGGIALFGAPAVSLCWQPKLGFGIKLLAFKPNTPYLAVIDIKDSLMIYDLSSLSPVTQEPTRICVTSLRGHSTCIHAPAAGHSHIFIGFREGSIDAFDVLAGKLSPYRIPNLWLAQEDMMRRSGMLDAPRKGHTPACMDIKTHPRDINLLLVAYEGGVALWNIRDKISQGSYDMALPPGATGGGTETADDIFSERRPGVTCIAWRPDGMLFAVGHDDGCIAIWDPQDIDVPVQVRTLDRPDVNLMNPEGLFGTGSPSDTAGESGAPDQTRLPVFTLAWSGFPQEGLLDKVKDSGAYYMGTSKAPEIPAAPEDHIDVGTTILTVLGGTLPTDAMGVHCLVLPPFKATTDAKRSLRQAFRDSVQPLGRMFYPTQTEPQDFLLLARSAHYNLTFDPSAILILQAPDSVSKYSHMQTEQSLSSLKAFHFSWVSNSRAQELALPPLLQLYAHAQVLQAKYYTCSASAYQDLVSIRATHAPPYVGLTGGAASTKRVGDSSKSSKSAARRILVTAHADLSLQFWDASDALLEGKGLHLARGFPEWLFQLQLRRLLELHPNMLAARLFRQTPDLLTVSHFDVSLDSGEIAVALSSGDLIVFRLSVSEAPDVDTSEEAPHEAHYEDMSQPLEPSSEKRPRKFTLKRSAGHQEAVLPNQAVYAATDHLQIENLSHLPFAPRGLFTFLPVCSIQKSSQSSFASLSLSSVGFLAIGWSDGAMSTIDLRGPDEMLHVRLAEPAPQLCWTISRIESRRQPRLVASTASGTTLVYSFDHVLGNWICTSKLEPPSFHHDSLASPLHLSVFDRQGHYLAPSAALLRDIEADDIGGSTKDELHSFLLVASKSSASIFVNIGGERLGKVEYSVEAKTASIVHRYNQPALLVMFADSSSCLYALPSLAEIQRRKPLPSEPSVELVSLSTDGDLVDLSQRYGLRLKTVWSENRPLFPSALELWQEKAIEALPDSMSISSWVNWLGGKAVTADQLDGVLAGPARKLRFPKVPVKEALVTPTPPAAVKSPQRAPLPSQARTQRNIMESHSAVSETRDALQERSQRLEFLQDTMDEVSKGASDLVSSAKRLALQQSAKNTITSLFR